METLNTPDSSFLKSVQYDNENKELTVNFKNGKVFTYVDVPRETYMDMITNTELSVGSHYSRFIKGKFPIKKEPENQ